jgi:hypothetical protein
MGARVQIITICFSRVNRKSQEKKDYRKQSGARRRFEGSFPLEDRILQPAQQWKGRGRGGSLFWQNLHLRLIFHDLV